MVNSHNNNFELKLLIDFTFIYETNTIIIDDHIGRSWKRILIQNNLNYGKNMDLIKEIFMKNRGYMTEAPKEELVMLLFSGGINSTVLIDLCV